MTLRSLLTYIEVIERRNFTAAGEALGLSQSAVTRHISGLEAEFNQQFLVRSPRMVVPTEAGMDFYLNTKNYLDAIYKESANPKHRQLKIGTFEGFLQSFLVPMIGEVLEKTGVSKIEFAVDRSVNLHRQVRECAIDCCITSTNIQTDLVTSLHLLDEELLLCSVDKKVNLGDINSYNWVIFGERDPLMKRKKRTTKKLISCNSYAALISLVQQGVGVAVLPDHIVKNTKLHAVPYKAMSKQALYLSTLGYQKLPLHLEKLVDVIKQAKR